MGRWPSRAEQLLIRISIIVGLGSVKDKFRCVLVALSFIEPPHRGNNTLPRFTILLKDLRFFLTACNETSSSLCNFIGHNG
jgi:hypothetical protein